MANELVCEDCDYYVIRPDDAPVIYWPGLGRWLCESCAEFAEPDRSKAETSDLPDLEDADAVLAWLDKE